MSKQVQPLIEYLKQLQKKGESHIHLDHTARMVKREFFLAAKGHKKITTKSPDLQDSDSQHEENIQQQIENHGSSAQEKISSLASQATSWTAAKTLNSLRDTLVFSGGNPNADLMFIADAPGYFEENKGHPFAGTTGDKLDGILKAMGLTRNEIYITHLVKFRPSMPNQTTATRKPNAQEIAAFAPFIDAEIQTVNPKIIVALGTTVAHHILDSEEPVDQLRGEFHHTQRTSIPIRVTYHPSYLLQTETNTDKRKLWEDMLSLMEKLDMPISDKQRNFFLPKP